MVEPITRAFVSAIDRFATEHGIPVSAVIELVAVTVFAFNLGVIFLRPPAHLMQPAR
jgi:hypothetical protein